MVRFGLLTEHPTKPKKVFFGKYTEEIFRHEKNPFELIIVTVPFSERQLERMKEKRRRKIFTKASEVFLKRGAKKVFFSPGIKKFSDKETHDEFRNGKKRLFDNWVYPCVTEMTGKCGIKLLDAKVCITDSKMERISETLMEKLCYDTKNPVLCTENQAKAQLMCERFLEEKGMNVKITSQINPNNVDVLIDVDNSSVRIGRDLTIDGVSGDFETGGFPIDLIEITASVEDFGISDRNLSYFSGKKKLTL